jgi:AcrR family transcriptional regulator
MQTKMTAAASSRESAAAKSRARILKAATNLFAERGFDATSTMAIAEEAGVPSGLIFYYFGTKEALLDEIFNGYALPDEIRRIFAEVANDPPIMALKDAATQIFRWLDKNKDIMRLYFKEMTSHRPVSSQLGDSRRRNIECVAAYLDKAIACKEMEPTNTRVLAQVFISSLLLAALFDSYVNINTFVRTLAEAVAGKKDHSASRR